MSTFTPPNIGGQPMSPVHFSHQNGVHADIGHGRNKMHIPFEGQTTLPTFRIGGVPGHANDQNLADLGGTFRG